MKISECHRCEHYQLDPKNRNDRCGLTGKLIETTITCPKKESSKPWTPEDRDRLMKLIGSGTHLRNIALIMERTYTDIEDKMKLEYTPPTDDERTCDNCGYSGYCSKQYKAGCGHSQWKPLTVKQIKERILLETRKGGLGITY